MEFMTWALETATKHPKLANALVSANGDWLDFLLDDGRTFRFRPGAMIKQDAPEADRTEILNRLIAIGIEQAEEPKISEDDAQKSLAAETARTAPQSSTSLETPEPIDISEDNTPIVPIVRAADYFISPQTQSDPLVHIPLTDFIAVGLAYDLPDSIHPVYFSQLAEEDRNLGEIMAESVVTLRHMTNAVRQTVEIGITKVAGADVMTFLQPANYELSWFADLDMMQQVADRIAEDRPNDLPLFVPASKTKLYVVFSDDPHLADFFQLLLDQREAPEAVYPLPHTIAADGWREWVPFPGSPIAEVLGTLRNYFRERMYSNQVHSMHAWGDFSTLKPFVPRRLKSGERVSTTTWDASDGPGSIPETDYITFTRERSPHPWEDAPAVDITIRSQIAHDVWPEGFEKMEKTWPTRWHITQFPTDDVLLKLRDSANRGF